MEQLVKRLNIANRTKFTGFREDIERFYSIADIFVLPSLYEGFGHVYIEAMASGVPCIGLKSNYPKIVVACEEIIRNGKTGYCIDHYSIEDLSDRMKEILLNRELKEKFGKEARNICENTYSWENHIKKILNLCSNSNSGTKY